VDGLLVLSAFSKILLIYSSEIISVNGQNKGHCQGWKAALEFFCLCSQRWDKDFSVSKSDSRCVNIYCMSKQPTSRMEVHVALLLYFSCAVKVRLFEFSERSKTCFVCRHRWHCRARRYGEILWRHWSWTGKCEFKVHSKDA